MNAWNFDPEMMKQMESNLTNMAATTPPPPVTRATNAVKLANGKTLVVPERNPDRQTQQQSELQKLQDLFARMSESSQQEKSAVDAYENAPRKLDLSPLMALSDAWFGGNQAKSYQAPETPEQKQIMLAKLRNNTGEADRDLLKQQMSLYMGGKKDDTNYLKAILAATVSGNRQTASAEDKENKELDKQTQKFGDAMDSYKQKASAIGTIAGTNVRASRLAALIDSIPGGNLNDQEMSELALGMAAMATNSNRVPIELEKQLKPLSAEGQINKLKQWFINNPVGNEQQAFVKRMGTVIHREQQLATEQLVDLRRKAAAQHQSLYENPKGRERVYNIADLRGISQDEIDSIFDRKKRASKPYQELPMSANPEGFYSKDVVNGGKSPVTQVPFSAAKIEAAAAKSNQSVDQIKAQLKAKGIPYEE